MEKENLDQSNINSESYEIFNSESDLSEILDLESSKLLECQNESSEIIKSTPTTISIVELKNFLISVLQELLISMFKRLISFALKQFIWSVAKWIIGRLDLFLLVNGYFLNDLQKYILYSIVYLIIETFCKSIMNRIYLMVRGLSNRFYLMVRNLLNRYSLKKNSSKIVSPISIENSENPLEGDQVQKNSAISSSHSARDGFNNFWNQQIPRSIVLCVCIGTGTFVLGMAIGYYLCQKESSKLPDRISLTLNSEDSINLKNVFKELSDGVTKTEIPNGVDLMGNPLDRVTKRCSLENFKVSIGFSIEKTDSSSILEPPLSRIVKLPGQPDLTLIQKQMIILPESSVTELPEPPISERPSVKKQKKWGKTVYFSDLPKDPYFDDAEELSLGQQKTSRNSIRVENENP